VKRLNTDGVEIAYLEQGKGPAVIIAHCSSASHKEWLPLIEELAPDWRVLAPDFIGYGQSDAWPENKVFTGQADPAVLLELAKKTKRPIHLVGHSYGAALALEAARELGPKVQSLILVEAGVLQALALGTSARMGRGRAAWRRRTVGSVKRQ
jgi:pimeloyl-ACP methyl ester carboxylesterase